ncbi:MAG: alpha/beta hydrolase [Deltaproteobacteria bacterium]|nr:alpha/beta hydrolase [Deltaproteobacteria bacterium]
MASLRSSVFRLFTKYYLRPKFSVGKTVEEHRKAFERASRLILLPFGTNTELVSINGIKAEWVSVGNVSEEKIILFLHGGTYTFGSINTHRGIAARMSKYSGCKALVLDYRLAPEYPFPAAVEDSTNAFQWLIESGISPNNIAIVGDSAGGGLSLATMLILRDNGDPLPGAAICFSPWIDLEGKGESNKANIGIDPLISPEWFDYMAAFYVGNNDIKNPQISPIYADLKGFPPMLIQAGSDEVILDDSKRLAEQALEVGVEVTLDIWENMWHVWQLSGGLMPEATMALQKAGEFVRKHID